MRDEGQMRLGDQGMTAADAENLADMLDERDALIGMLKHALWSLVGDVEAMHRSHVPSPGDPLITKKEIANLEYAKEVLDGYEPPEIV